MVLELYSLSLCISMYISMCTLYVCGGVLDSAGDRNMWIFGYGFFVDKGSCYVVQADL
jgi:hypothetical protein